MIATAVEMPVVEAAENVETPPAPVAAAAAVRRLPPSERDVEIYRAIALEGMPTREAARSAGISQTRVRQIVARVVRWIGETLPAALADELAPEVALKLAQGFAAQRLELMYSHAMTAWRNTTQPRYLSLAIRVTTAQSRLPIAPMLLDCAMAEAIESPEHEVDRVSGTSESHATSRPPSSPAPGSQGPAPRSAPPVRDCSPRPTAPTAASSRPAAEGVASSLPTSSSKPLTPEQAAARRALLADAAPLLGGSKELLVSPSLSGNRHGGEKLLRRIEAQERKEKQRRQ